MSRGSVKRIIETRLVALEGENGRCLTLLKQAARKGESIRLGLALYFFNHIVACLPAHWLRLFFYRRVFKIGKGSSILMGVTLWRPANLVMGEHSTINSGCTIDSRGGLTIGNNVNIAGHVHIWSAEHDIDSPTHQTIHGHVTIADHAWIASRATILPGVTIGQGGVVAAGAVVTKDVPPFTVVGGVPAKKIRERSRDLRYQIKNFPFLR